MVEGQEVKYGDFETFEEYQKAVDEKIAVQEKTVRELMELKGTQGRELGDLRRQIEELSATRTSSAQATQGNEDPFTAFMSNPDDFIGPRALAQMKKYLASPEGRSLIYQVLASEEDKDNEGQYKNPHMGLKSSLNWLHALNDHPELKTKEFQTKVQAKLDEYAKAGNKINYVTAASLVKKDESHAAAEAKGHALTADEKRMAAEKAGKFGGGTGGGAGDTNTGGGGDDDKSPEDQIADSIMEKASSGDNSGGKDSPI